MNERTRIARELHDTLLQTFHGLLFRFQAVRNMLPRRPEEAIQALDTALEQGGAGYRRGPGRDSGFTFRADRCAQRTGAAADSDGPGTAGGSRMSQMRTVMRSIVSVTVEGERQTCLRFCRTKFTGLPGSYYEMLSGTHRHTESKRRFDTTTAGFACVSATMEKASTRKFWRKADAPDTGDCPESASVRNESAGDGFLERSRSGHGGRVDGTRFRSLRESSVRPSAFRLFRKKTGTS